MQIRHLLQASLTCALLAGCQSEPVKAPVSHEYDREFVRTFGVPDHDHDWNMAGRVTANIETRGLAPGYEVRIYDRMPGTEGCQIAARFSATTKTVEFDFAKSNRYAYVEIVGPDGRVVSVKSLAIRNRAMQISADAAIVSPGEAVKEKVFDMASSITVADKTVTFKDRLPDGYDNSPYNTEFRTTYPDLKPRNAYDLFLLCEEQPGGHDLHSATVKPVFDDTDQGMACSDLTSIVGTNGVFHEKCGPVDCNLMKYWEELKPTTNSVFTVAETGPVSIDYLYGCGTFWNSFGYFYYDDTYTDIEIMRAPKYILMLDASPWHNMQRLDPAKGEQFEDFELIGESDTKKENWNGEHKVNQSGMRPANDVERYEKMEKQGADLTAYDVRYRGTSHRLVYYPQIRGINSHGYPGVKADLSKPSYDFPKGTKIGFFIICEGGFFFSDKGRAMGRSAVRYSLPWMNAWLGRPFHHKDGNKKHTGCSKIPADTPPTWFMSYKWNGRTILGIEDGEYGNSDHDMNDILFEVKGSFAIDRQDLGHRTKVQSWVVACEDLGSTDDFDFNDVVFGVSHLTSDEDDASTLVIKPLAAGGTLKVQLCMNGEPVGDGRHWNEYFGHQSHHDIINVTGNASRPVESEEIVITEGIPKDFSLSSGSFRENMGGFSLRVFDDEGNHVTSVKAPGTQGDDAVSPQMILLPVNWSWPREMVAIHDAYPGTHNGNVDNPIAGFGSWVHDGSQYSWTFYPAEDSKVFSNTWEAPDFGISPIKK